MSLERAKILVFGATGAIGRHVVAEAVSRGHDVTGVVRNSRAANPVGIRLVQADAMEPLVVRRLAKGHDVVVSATRPSPGREGELVETARSLVAGLTDTGCRLLVVGGAASLIVPGSDGTLALDDPDYVRDEWRAIAHACAEQLAVLQRAASVACTYVSPPAFIEPGPRTGAYRLGTDQLVVDAHGRSRMSYADFAVAIVDEVHNRKFTSRRLSVGY